MLAKAVGAQCYTDPFVSDPTPVSESGLMSRMVDWFADRASGGGGGPRMGSMRPRGA